MIEIDALDEQMRRVLIEDGCRWVYSSISSTCEEFSLLLRTMEDLIEREKTTELEGLSKYAERLPDARRDDFWQDHHPYWWDQIITAHFRASFLMALMAAVESHVLYICENVRTILRTSESPKDGKGTIYARARQFLWKHGQFVKPPKKNWEDIEDLYALRNILVHRNRLVQGSWQESRIAELVSRTSGIRIEIGHVEIDRVFCETSLEWCKTLLLELHEELARFCAVDNAAAGSLLMASKIPPV